MITVIKKRFEAGEHIEIVYRDNKSGDAVLKQFRATHTAVDYLMNLLLKDNFTTIEAHCEKEKMLNEVIKWINEIGRGNSLLGGNTKLERIKYLNADRKSIFISHDIAPWRL